MKKPAVSFFKVNEIYKMDDGIICFKARQDDVYNRTDLVAIIELLADANEGKPFLLLMDIGRFDFLMTKHARNLFNTYDRAIDLIISEAVAMDSKSMRIMYNLLSKLHSPKFPFKAFNKLSAARKWLNTHR
ncbi:MAG: hypothetical protein ACI9FU_000621 [Granulosicoccus sp.]